MKQALWQWCDTHAEEQLALLKTLAAIPAPSHHEEQRAQFILDWLRAAGAERAYMDAALNVVLPFGEVESGGISVFMAHTDVVFPDTAPLPVREEEGRLYAPGAGDDTANVVALMLCAKYLLAGRLQPKQPVLIVFNSCEEGLGNLKGVRRIMADFAGRIKDFVSFDGQCDSIVHKAVGSERWRVTVSTKGGHSYAAFGNPNAIVHLADLIVKLNCQPLPSAPDTKTTYNVGTIQGGTSVNTIAQNAEMTYEYRSDDAAALERMRQQFLALLKCAGQEDVHFTAELIGERPCDASVPEEEKQRHLARCCQAIAAVTGVSPTLRSGSTDANIPLSLGIPAATFGLYRGAGAHTRQEYVEIDSLLPGLKIGLCLITTCFHEA